MDVRASYRQTTGAGCWGQHQQMSWLLAAGIHCWLLRGLPIRAAYAEVRRVVSTYATSIHHCNFMAARRYFICGSTSWATSSGSNEEASCLYLNSRGKSMLGKRLPRLLAMAALYTMEIQQRAQGDRERSLARKQERRDPSPRTLANRRSASVRRA